MEKLGFVKGTASPCHFYQPRTGIRILVHGDDLVAVGGELEELEAWTEQMKSHFPCVVKSIGPGRHQNKEVKVRGRKVRITESGVELEIDSKYVDQAIRTYELQDAK